jgi:hypothetical protein
MRPCPCRFDCLQLVGGGVSYNEGVTTPSRAPLQYLITGDGDRTAVVRPIEE